MSDWLEIHALADGELTGEDKKRAEERLRTSERDRAEFASVQAVKAALAEKCQPVTCDETWKKCQKRIAELDRSKGVESFITRYAWGICSLFLVLIVSAAMWTRLNGSGFRPGEIANIASTIPSQAQPISQSYSAKQQFLQNLLKHDTPIRPSTIYLIGAGERTVNGQRIVKVDLHDAIGPVTLIAVDKENAFEVPAQTSKIGDCYVGKVNDLNCIIWSEHGTSYMVTGARDPEGLKALRDKIFNP